MQSEGRVCAVWGRAGVGAWLLPVVVQCSAEYCHVLRSCPTGDSCEIESENVCYEGDGFKMVEDTCEESVGSVGGRKYTFGAEGDFSSMRRCPVRGYPQMVGKVTVTDVHGGATKTFLKYR